MFDLDGVIVDTHAVIKEALRALACNAGVTIDPDVLDATVLLPPVNALLALGVSDARQIYDSDYDKALSLATGEVLVFNEVVAGMATLAKAGVGLGIVTAQARGRLRYLLPPEVAELVEVVIAHEDAPAKPAPDGILAACARLGVPPERAFFIGDRTTDVRAGRAAGVTTVGASWGIAGATALQREGVDVLLATPDQVGPSILAQIDSRRGHAGS
ncbi:HAD-IA family hydrolase [Nocardia sp. NPDC049190]|uniref:HAD family hydrolase n=1 Tax=Nocardia sp. NPDC049190 TaxID=3155650 RepID=UPI0033CC463B